MINEIRTGTSVKIHHEEDWAFKHSGDVVSVVCPHDVTVRMSFVEGGDDGTCLDSEERLNAIKAKVESRAEKYKGPIEGKCPKLTYDVLKRTVHKIKTQR